MFNNKKLIVISLFLTNIVTCFCNNIELDVNGYIAYCPCMGRFGNQADHFLGALGFAKSLNRTLILPAWVEYRIGELRSLQVPFDTYFNVTHLKTCHKVILMEEFMKEIASNVWPSEYRIAFCYSPRGNTTNCNPKEGNPFGPFWDTYNIDFVDSEFYGPMHYDMYHGDMANQWKKKYPVVTWPVLAFTGAPATFPVQLENKYLQKCLQWTDDISERAKNFIKQKLPAGAFIGIHLRNGIDWVRACEFTSSSPNLFAAPQCLGYRNERGKATSTMCFPPLEIILRHIKRVIRNDNNIKSIFVASDNNYMINELNIALARMEVRAFRQEEPVSSHLDLAILGKANYFIGNCISTFSAFVARERDVKGLPTFFWGFPPEKGSAISNNHEEL